MRAAVLLVVLALAGCPSRSNGQGAPSAARACTRIGQTCEVAPGKLGSCVQRDDCAQGDCFVCQSQH